jgi:predicted RNase H-like HicB family nuclease
MDEMQSGYYTVHLTEELHEGGEPTWFAEHPDLPGCHAVGTTPDEASANLDKSRDAWLKWAGDHSVPYPPPEEEPSTFVQYAIHRNVSRTKGTAADIADQQTFAVT